MWQQIALNKRNSYILLTLMLILFLIIGAALGVLVFYYMGFNNPEFYQTGEYIYTEWGEIPKQELSAIFASAQSGLLVALVVWIVLFIIAMTNGKNAILALNQAYKVPKNAHRILENVVEEMSIAAGLPKPPEIYVIDTAMPNAFATGISPKNCAVAVTTGLLTELDREELQGVIAHEIAHIVNRDTMYMIFAGIMIGSIVILSEFGLRYMRHGCFRSSRRSRSGGKGEVLLFVICIILMILAPILAQLLYFSISQRREYLADACAVQYTRYPQGLASALAKISGSLYMFRDADKITSAMYIVHPLDYEIKYKSTYSMFGNAFSTHPPTEKRIAILSKMVGADFNAYNEAFKKVADYGQTILKKEFLYGVKPVSIKDPNEKPQNTFNPMGVAAGAVVISALSQDEKANEEKKIRKREAENIVLKANDYIFKECTCGTKFKFPQEYQGETVKCPHCGSEISVT